MTRIADLRAWSATGTIVTIDPGDDNVYFTVNDIKHVNILSLSDLNDRIAISQQQPADMSFVNIMTAARSINWSHAIDNAGSEAALRSARFSDEAIQR